MAPTLDLFLAQQDSVKAPAVSLPRPKLSEERTDVPAIVVPPPLAPSAAAAGKPWLGYSLAALGHALLLGSLLIFLGSAGAPQQTSENTIEVEIVVEAPGAPGDRSEQEQPPSDVQIAESEPEPVKEPEPTLPDVTPPEVEQVTQETQPEPPLESQPAPQQLEANTDPAPVELPPIEKIAPPPKTEAEAPVFIPPPKPAPAKPQRVSAAKETPKPKQKPAERPVRRPPTQARPIGDGGANGRQAVAGQNAMSIDAFRAAVIARIARNKPSTDIAAKAQGVVIVSFGVAPNGAAQGPHISRSSGSATLDNAALQTVRRASPFPPPPPGAPRSFNVPIRFNVR
jgi:protein TonB